MFVICGYGCVCVGGFCGKVAKSLESTVFPLSSECVILSLG